MNRSEALRALSPIASEQGGLVTAAQATLVDVTGVLLHELVQGGYLEHVRRGVYAFKAGHAPDRFEDIASAWLAVDARRLPWQRRDRPVAVVSHASAAHIHGLGTIVPGLPELTAPKQSQRSDLKVHVAPIEPTDWEWQMLTSGLRLPVTTPVRTIVDLLLAGEEVDYLQKALHQAFDEPPDARDALLATLARRRKPNAKQRRWAEDVLRRLTEPSGLSG